MLLIHSELRFINVRCSTIMTFYEHSTKSIDHCDHIVGENESALSYLYGIMRTVSESLRV